MLLHVAAEGFFRTILVDFVRMMAANIVKIGLGLAIIILAIFSHVYLPFSIRQPQHIRRGQYNRHNFTNKNAAGSLYHRQQRLCHKNIGHSYALTWIRLCRRNDCSGLRYELSFSKRSPHSLSFSTSSKLSTIS